MATLNRATGQVLNVKPEGSVESLTQCLFDQMKKLDIPQGDQVTVHTCAVRQGDANKINPPDADEKASPPGDATKEWHDRPGQLLDRKDSVTI